MVFCIFSKRKRLIFHYILQRKIKKECFLFHQTLSVMKNRSPLKYTRNARSSGNASHTQKSSAIQPLGRTTIIQSLPFSFFLSCFYILKFHIKNFWKTTTIMPIISSPCIFSRIFKEFFYILKILSAIFEKWALLNPLTFWMYP